MLTNLDVLYTLRSRLLTVEIATTGATTLTATGNGFTRATGSFITDGFKVGMEVTPAGFTDNTPGVIKSVTATTITLFTSRPSESSGAGRTLTVGIPQIRAWENLEPTILDKRWFIEEDFMSGPSQTVTLGPNATINHQPLYIIKLYGLSGTGPEGLYALADGVLAVFPPRLALTMSDGNLLRVRSEPAPWRGQVLPGEAGRSLVVVSIPLWVRTTNPI